MSDRLVIKRHAPGRARLVLAAAAVLGVLALWGLFEWGRKAGGYDRFEAAAEREAFEAEVARLEGVNDDLTRQLAVLETADKIEQKAYGEVSEELGDLQSQIAELNKELAFYRSVMAPADGDTGLQIQAVQLFRNGGEGGYQLKLVLVQAGPQDRRVKGAVTVALLGAEGTGGAVRRLDLTEVSGDEEQMRYSFRYFQILEWDFTLPDGFLPAEIEVNLKPSSKGDAVVAAFPWQVAET